MTDTAMYNLTPNKIWRLRKPESFEVLDGVMLGDGNLSKPAVNACLRYGKSGNDHIDLVHYVKEQLEEIGVVFASNMPKALTDENLWLSSRVHIILTGEYFRWYHNGKKEVPEDILLSPRTLAVLFMDDGSSTYSHKSGPTVTVYLATHSFSEYSIKLLEKALLLKGINTGRDHDKRVKGGAGIYITILQDSVDLFMSTVSPYVFPSYQYKIKYRRQQA